MTDHPDKHDALYLASAARRGRVLFTYRCGIEDHGATLAKIHATDHGPLLVAHGARWQQLDADDDVSSNPFVIDHWRDLSDGDRGHAAWVRAAELVMQRDHIVGRSQAVPSYASLVAQQSQAAAGLLRQPSHDAAWLHDIEDAIVVSCRTHPLRTLSVADAIALQDAARQMSKSTAFIV